MLPYVRGVEAFFLICAIGNLLCVYNSSCNVGCGDDLRQAVGRPHRHRLAFLEYGDANNLRRVITTMCKGF